MKWDVFISHAGEDKAGATRPLAEHTQVCRSGLMRTKYSWVIAFEGKLIKDWPNPVLECLSE